MAPQKRAAGWQPEADEATLLGCFRWEIAQSLKLSIVSFEEYNKQNKITFLRNYAAHIPLHKLWHVIVAEFAPPLQQKIAVISRVLDSQLPAELVERVLGYIPGWPQGPRVQQGGASSSAAASAAVTAATASAAAVIDVPYTPLALQRLCVSHFFSSLEVKGGKLMVSLPKDHDWSSKTQDKRVSHLMALPWVQRDAWWNPHRHPWRLLLADERHRLAGLPGPLRPLPDTLVSRIVAIENEVTPIAVATTLALPAPPANPQTERHSLEIMVKEITHSAHRHSRSTRAFATMVVPDDASVAELDGWMCQLDPTLASWCYLHVKDMDQKYKEEQLREQRKNLLWRANHDQSTPADAAAEAEHQPWKPPWSLTARISRMQMNDDYGWDSDGGFPKTGAERAGGLFRRVPVRGSRAALITEKMAEHEGPTKFPECEDSDSWTFSERFGVLGDLGAEPKSTTLDITDHVAICDVLPMPEERMPLLEEFLVSDRRHIFGMHVDMEWSRSEHEYELFALRRLPRLPDADYPVVRRTNSTPRCPL